MDPTRGDSRYNLNYGMGGIGLSLADQADLYGNPAAVLASSGGGGLNNRPPSGGLIQSMGGGGSGSGRSSSGLMHHSSTGGNSTNQCQTLGGSGGNSNQQQQQQQQQQQSARGIKRTSSGCYEDHHRNSAGQQMSSQGLQNLDNCGPGGQHSGNGTPQDMVGGGSGGGGGGSGNPDENYTSLQTNKKSPPANGKKTKGRVKIKMEYIDNKLRRYTTFSKRKTGIMKKAYELSTLTGTQVMLLVASETGHVYTFATRKLQPMITSEAGKQLIQTCLNSPDPPPTGGTGDQRMSATGFEETELSYNIADEDSKDDRSPCSSGNETDDSSDMDSPCPISSNIKNSCGIGSSSGNTIPNEITLPDSPIIISTNNSSSNNNNNNSTIIHNIINNQQSQHKHSSSQVSGTSGHHHQQSSQIITSIGSSSNSQQHHHGGNSTNSNSGGTTATTTISGTSNTSNVQFSGINNVLYPSTLANIPQEVLLSLVQAGHLQLHTDEDGSGHQIISIPLTMTSNTSGSSNLGGNSGNSGTSSRNITSGSTNNNNNQFGLLTSSSGSTSTPTISSSTSTNIIGISGDNNLIPSNSTVGHIVSLNSNNNNNSSNIGGGINKIHVKDLSNKIGNSSSNSAFEISAAVLVSGSNDRESPSSAPPSTIRIKKEIE